MPGATPSRRALDLRRAPQRAGRRPASRRLAPGDLIAGASVALVLIPQSLAYAKLAGMPPERGLYAAAIPLIVAAPLASSPYLQTGPAAITSLLAFGALSAVAEPGSDEYVQLGMLLALLVGVIRLGLGAARAGFLAHLMSQPMLAGFIPAAATLIVCSQLPAALAANAPEGDILERAGWTVVHPAAWNAEALALTVATVAVVLSARRVHPLLPGVLLAIVACTLWSVLSGFEGPTLGTVAGDLPALSVSLPWSEGPGLLVAAVVIALVGFVEASAVGRTFAAHERLAWDPDRELLAQGSANIAAGVTGGFPVGGSLSRSSLNRLAGARSSWSGAVTGLVVLAVLPLAFLLSDLPTAALAAIVIAAATPLLRFRAIWRLWPSSRPATLIAVVTFAATLLTSPRIERGVLVGIGLSVAVHLWRELRLDVETWQADEALHLRPHGVLWFGVAEAVEERLVAELARHPSLDSVRIHLDAVGRLDITAAMSLHSVIQELQAAGVDVELEGVQSRDRRLVDGVVRA